MPDDPPTRPKENGSLRQRWHDIIFEADTPAGKAFDVVLLLAIASSVGVIMLESVDSFRAEHSTFLRVAEWVFTILFTLEYFVRIWISENKRAYIFSFFGIVDLLSILPTYVALFLTGSHYLAVLRVLRMIRMFRVLKMVRHMNEGDVLLRALKASRAKIVVFLIGVLALISVMGTLMYLIEGEENGFTSIPVAIYWAIVTITTVGFGDITPQTPLGQLVSAVVMITGYAIFAVPTFIVGTEVFGEVRRERRRRCRKCGADNHPREARFCHSCGEILETDPPL